eukprot:1683520-Pyramimonas_sp.AAC.1
MGQAMPSPKSLLDQLPYALRSGPAAKVLQQELENHEKLLREKNNSNPQAARQRMLRSDTECEQQTKKLQRFPEKRRHAEEYLADCEEEVTVQSRVVFLAEQDKEAVYADYRALRRPESRGGPQVAEGHT